MERYPIPQFIEQEGKIAFFISFRQFFYLLFEGVICFLLYFTVPRWLFFILAFLVFAIAIILAFATYQGIPILSVFLGAFGFITKGKNYTWKKKESPYPFKTIKRAEIKKIKEGPALKGQQSRLRKMHTEIEMHSK